MADYLIAIAALACLTACMLSAWRRVSGRPRSTARAVGRFLLAAAVALVAVGFITYRVTKARDFQLAGELVRRVETDERVVALTFDDGPTSGYTEEILRELEAHDAVATFYLTGAACEENPELLQMIVDAGHELGNHSYTHRRMYFVSERTVAEEIERTDAVFRRAGYEGPITFRMPGCKRLLTTPLYLARNRRTTVVWDLEPDSIPDIASDPDALVDYVTKNTRPGSIVLMHVMYEAREPTREALPRILEQLSAEGYRFVTVSELLALRNE